MMMRASWRGAIAILLLATACAPPPVALPPADSADIDSAGENPALAAPPESPKAPAPSESSESLANDGKYYLDDGPPSEADRLAALNAPDAVVRWDPISPVRNRPYVALGKRYAPYRQLRPYRRRGVASWYGRRYHGRQTASGEVYDMLKMTAAHPLLPIPSYVRVTRVDTSDSVVVRVNDRGPFLGGRLIDLSYAAAARLDFVAAGVAEVIVEAILPPGYDPGEAPPAPDHSTAEPVKTLAPLPAGAGKVYIQLAAFLSATAADEYLSALSRELPDDWRRRASIAAGEDGWFRAQIGPYETREEAAAADATLCRQYSRCGFLTQRR